MSNVRWKETLSPSENFSVLPQPQIVPALKQLRSFSAPFQALLGDLLLRASPQEALIHEGMLIILRNAGRWQFDSGRANGNCCRITQVVFKSYVDLSIVRHSDMHGYLTCSSIHAYTYACHLQTFTLGDNVLGVVQYFHRNVSSQNRILYR